MGGCWRRLGTTFFSFCRGCDFVYWYTMGAACQLKKIANGIAAVKEVVLQLKKQRVSAKMGAVCPTQTILLEKGVGLNNFT